jgi:hypothetical protein
MATITTINDSDLITNSNDVINANFANLNNDKIETSVIDTDTSLAANSDSKLASQKAVKAYVDAGGNVNASTTTKGIVEEATQAEVSAGTTAGGTGARLFVNPSSVTSKLVTTQVFSGNAPNATMTDLDLSAVVGARSCVVMLKVSNGDVSTRVYTFRRNGETGDFGSLTAATAFGSSKINVIASGVQYVIVTTDASGIVEWTGSAAATTTINVEAYW